jgi:Leucine-rich repeat (LRR) protein
VNSLTSLKDVATCKKLTELYLRKNKIENIAEIAFLKHLPLLRILWISDNALESTPNFRATVIKALPRVVRLDNVGVSARLAASISCAAVVTAAERLEALETGLDIDDKVCILLTHREHARHPSMGTVLEVIPS